MKKKMPKTIYAKWDDSDPNGGPYLVVSENWETHADLGEKHVVGTYQLVQTDYVISETRKVPKRS